MNDRLKSHLNTFFFPPSDVHWIGILRVGMGLQVFLSCFSLRQDWHALLVSRTGLVSRELCEAILDFQSPLIPRLGWLVESASYFHINEQTVLSLVWAMLMTMSGCLIVGLFCRPAAFLSWFLYLSTIKSANLYAYGADNFTIIGLFYLLIAPLPDNWALDRWWQHRSFDPRRIGWHRRLLQLHLCVVYFFGGLTKALGAGWWNGHSIWRALTCPPYDYIPASVLLSLRYLLPLAGILVILFELTYPAFIWGKRTRPIWLAGIITIHAGIGLAMGLYLFAFVMIVLNLAGFAPMGKSKIEKALLSPASLPGSTARASLEK